MTQQTTSVTLLLNQWQSGDKQALDDLIPMIYQELRQLANAQLSINKGHSIHCTQLVNEAYLRLVDVENLNYNDRNHFFSIAARTMRRVLVDNFRLKQSAKRNSNATLLTLMEDTHNHASQSVVDLHSLEEALLTLEQLDPRQVEIVTMRFFGGLKTAEIAEILSVSTRTVRREWAMARIWLFRAMQ